MSDEQRDETHAPTARPERVQAAFDVWRGRQQTGPNATALFEYIEALEAGRLAVPDDVVELVVAARVVAFEDQSPEALNRLDRAVEVFAERVAWDNDPAAIKAIHGEQG